MQKRGWPLIFLFIFLIGPTPANAISDLCRDLFLGKQPAVFVNNDVRFIQIYYAQFNDPVTPITPVQVSVVQTLTAHGSRPVIGYLTELGSGLTKATELRSKAQNTLDQAFGTSARYTEEYIAHLDHLNDDLPLHRISNSMVVKGKAVIGNVRIFDGSIHDPGFPERSLLYSPREGRLSTVLTELQNFYFSTIQKMLRGREKNPSYDFLMPFERALIERGESSATLARLFPDDASGHFSYFEFGRYFYDPSLRGHLRAAVHNYLMFRGASMLKLSQLDPEKVFLFAHCYEAQSRIYSRYGFKVVGEFITPEGQPEFVMRVRGDEFLSKIGSDQVLEKHLVNIGAEHDTTELRPDGKLSQLLWPYTFGKVSKDQAAELILKVLRGNSALPQKAD